MIYYINIQDNSLYQGDCRVGDRQATDAEVAAWLAKVANPIPATVAMWQAKAALQAAGLLDKATAAITAANNPVLTAFWSGAATIDRTSPTLASIGTALGLTSSQLDQLFVSAAAISL